MEANAHPFFNTIAAQNHKKRIAKTRITRLSKRPIKRMKMTKIQKKNQCLGKQQQKAVQIVNYQKCLDPQQYCCAICIQLMINPTTLQCLHSFCLTCLQKLVTLTFNCVCSLCRSICTKPFFEIDNQKQQLIEIIHQSKLTPEQQSEYLLRKSLIERQELRDRGITNELIDQNQSPKCLEKGQSYFNLTSIKQNTVLSSKHDYRLIFYSSKVLNQEQLASLKNSNGQYYSFDIFQEERYVNTQNNIDNTYNIQDLLLQFNTYPYGYQYYPQNNIQSHQQQRHLQSQSSSTGRNTHGLLIAQHDTQSNITQ